MSSAFIPRAFAQPAPHRVIRNFLGPDLMAQLLAHAEEKQDAFVPTRLGDGRVDPKMRVSHVLRDLGPLRHILEAHFLAIMDPMVAELRLSPFKLGRLEIEMVAHGDGAYYSRHIDTRTGTFDRTTDRALTSILYFHAEPKAFSGGEFRLHSILPAKQGGSFVDIAPDRDTLLLLPSWAPHEVLPVACPSGAFKDQRFAINCWYRSQRAV